MNKVYLQQNVNFVINIAPSIGNSGNHVLAGYDATSSTHSGNLSYAFNTATGWDYQSSTDLCFYVYSDPETPSGKSIQRISTISNISSITI